MTCGGPEKMSIFRGSFLWFCFSLVWQDVDPIVVRPVPGAFFPVSLVLEEAFGDEIVNRLPHEGVVTFRFRDEAAAG